MSTGKASADEGDLDLKDLLAQLLARKWLLVVALVSGGLIGVLVGQLPPNEYRSAALVQIEERSNGVQLPTELIGELLGGLGGAQSSSFETEAHIIRSGLILRPVVEELDLATVVRPVQLPVVGDVLLRNSVPFAAGLLPGRYPRPGEEIAVARFLVPEAALDQPVVLTVGTGGAFTVSAGGTEVAGRVGAAVDLGARGSLLVSELSAAPGRQFLLWKRAERAVVAEIAQYLTVQERGARRDTGVVDFAYVGPDPDLAQEILATVIRTYQQANIQRRSVELDQSISFIEEQLPQVRQELEAATARLGAFRAQQGTQELSLGTQQLLELSVELETRLEEVDFRMEEALQRVTPNHPDYRALAAERERVAQRLANVQADLETIPEAEQTLAQLVAQAERAQQLEMQLVQRVEQLRILKASTVGNVRMLDPAGPAVLVGPNRLNPALIGMMAGLVLAAGYIFGRNYLRTGVEDARDVEALGLSLFATVSLDQDGKTKRTTDSYRLVATDPQNPVSEAFRGLRTGLQFSMAAAKNNVLMISSSAPGEGKSFVSSNLATAAAIGGSRVLLIDADLRRGKIHRPFGLRRRLPGFSQALAKDIPFDQVCYQTDIENLRFVPTGPKPPNPAELLSSPMFLQILEQVSQEYDLVVLDAPPVLAVTDPQIMGQHAGVTLLVCRHLVTSQVELQNSLKSFESVNVTVNGAILNQYDQSKSRYGKYATRYGYYYGGYKYKYAQDKSDRD